MTSDSPESSKPFPCVVLLKLEREGCLTRQLRADRDVVERVGLRGLRDREREEHVARLRAQLRAGGLGDGQVDIVRARVGGRTCHRDEGEGKPKVRAPLERVLTSLQRSRRCSSPESPHAESEALRCLERRLASGGARAG